MRQGELSPLAQSVLRGSIAQHPDLDVDALLEMASVIQQLPSPNGKPVTDWGALSEAITYAITRGGVEGIAMGASDSRQAIERAEMVFVAMGGRFEWDA